MINKIFILPLLLQLPPFLQAQINYSGSINPGNMFRLSDKSEISLPFRLAEAELGFSLGDFEIKTNSALEYRWSNNENEFQVREAYLIWYPSWGEVKLGKQIHAWGAVDGNNPTDNLNPYDYYYMFLPGTDRKLGSRSASINLIFSNYQIETVIIPKHIPNRLTFGEKDFPIKPPMDEPESFVVIKKPTEIGLRLRGSFPVADVSLSYFKGHDRMFSLFGFTPVINGIPEFHFGYREAEVYGVNLVTFLDDMTLRGEIGYFNSKGTVIKNEFNIQSNNAKYLQFVVQLEVPGPLDFSLNAQYIGSRIIEVSEITIVNATGMVLYHQDNNAFTPGMGTPFAMFTENGLSLSASGWLMDDRLELMGNTFIDLKDSQSMLGVSAKYSPMDNWKLNLSISKFMGEEGTQFNSMEDFSHLKIGLEYHF